MTTSDAEPIAAAALEALRPASVDEVSGLLRESTAEGRRLLVRGGGSRLGIANLAEPPDAALDLRDLRGVFELDAEEGVVHVAAGTALSVVAAEAYAAGFELPLDPPGAAATVGGALAAAAPGPRFALARDAVLGLGVVLATGESTHSGGRVVKNVTGYDLAKLHVGAFGSLGVIVSAWLRLRPRPESVSVLARKDETLGRVLELSQLATARAAAFEDGALILELAGDEAAVAADRARVPDLEEWGDSALEAVRVAQEAPARVRTRVAALPSRIVDASVPLREAGARILSYPGSGLLYAAFDAEAGALEATRAAARIGGGPFRVERAPDALRAQIDVFGELGEGDEQLPLHRALKQQFDPAGILNPGRFAGADLSEASEITEVQAAAAADEAGAPFASLYEGTLDCVHCGLCLPDCPTYRITGRETSSPRGRIYLMRAAAEGRIPLNDVVAEEMSLCLGCRACESACPSGVRYGALLEQARADISEAGLRTGWAARLERFALRHVVPHRVRLRLLVALAGLAQRLRLDRLVPPARLLPPVPPSSERKRLPARLAAQGERRGRVALFEGCVMPELFGPVNHATARVLARNGFEVVVPSGQGCCGALHAHAGDAEYAGMLDARNETAFSSWGAGAVVVNSAGCGAHLREQIDGVRDICELLDQEGLRRPSGRLDLRVCYDDPCHLIHGQGVSDAPRRLLKAIPGVELVEHDDPGGCCGAAGTYNLTQPAMSDAVLDRKMQALAAADPDVITTGNPGCLMQLRAGVRAHGLRAEVLHPVELLERAYRSDPRDPRRRSFRLEDRGSCRRSVLVEECVGRLLRHADPGEGAETEVFEASLQDELHGQDRLA